MPVACAALARQRHERGVTLGEREFEIMDVLWRNGVCSVAEVRGRLPDKLAYTTVLTILQNLERKGVVTHEAVGRSYRYHAAVTRDSVRIRAVAHLVETLFAGSASHLIRFLLTEHRTPSSEWRSLCRESNVALGADPRLEADA